MGQLRNHLSTESERSHNATDPSPNKVVTAEQLRMKPGQSLKAKARELGVSQLTLRIWTAEWKGSGFCPEYVIHRAGHENWLKNTWKSRDWPALVRDEVAKGRARHIGDVLLALGLTAANAQCWSQKHADFEQALWHSGVPYPAQHWRDFISWLRHGTIDRYRQLKAEYLANGIDEIEAMHRAADEAVDALKHKTRQRRRVERDTLLGIGGHQELLKRYRGNTRLTDAHSRRIAKKLHQVSRWVVMERALREVGYADDDVERMMAELMGAFEVSQEKGQAKWQQTRKAVLRRRQEADAFARAQEIETEMVEGYTNRRRRTAPIVAEWAERKYGSSDAKASLT
jgi:hypothetical protein